MEGVGWRQREPVADALDKIDHCKANFGAQLSPKWLGSWPGELTGLAMVCVGSSSCSCSGPLSWQPLFGALQHADLSAQTSN